MKRNSIAFIRVDAKGNVIPSTLIYRASMPKGGGKWIPIDGNVCCPSTTTTTTSTTTTTTTTAP